MSDNLQNGLTTMTDTASSAEACLRARPRHSASSIRCGLGDVIDLSIGGARVLTTSIPRSPVDVEFYAFNKSVTVRAHVAWTRRTGCEFQTEVGLVFRRLTRVQREMVDSLARGATHRALL